MPQILSLRPAITAGCGGFLEPRHLSAGLTGDALGVRVRNHRAPHRVTVVGRWEMGDGRWEMGDGGWGMGDDASRVPLNPLLRAVATAACALRGNGWSSNQCQSPTTGRPGCKGQLCCLPMGNNVAESPMYYPYFKTCAGPVRGADARHLWRRRAPPKAVPPWSVNAYSDKRPIRSLPAAQP